MYSTKITVEQWVIKLFLDLEFQVLVDIFVVNLDFLLSEILLIKNDGWLNFAFSVRESFIGIVDEIPGAI